MAHGLGGYESKRQAPNVQIEVGVASRIVNRNTDGFCYHQLFETPSFSKSDKPGADWIDEESHGTAY